MLITDSFDRLFHDPVGYAEGLDLIKAQFNGLGKIFSHSTVDRLEVLETPTKLPNTTILIDQDVTCAHRSRCIRVRKLTQETRQRLPQARIATEEGQLAADDRARCIGQGDEARRRVGPQEGAELGRRLLRYAVPVPQDPDCQGSSILISRDERKAHARTQLVGSFVSTDAGKI